MSFAHVLEGASPLAPDEIVDPGPICEVEFSISARGRADIEFFNRIDPVQSFNQCRLTSEKEDSWPADPEQRLEGDVHLSRLFGRDA